MTSRAAPSRTPTKAPAKVAAASAVVVGICLVIIALEYPSWVWWPLTIAFYASALVLVVSVVLMVRARYRTGRPSG